MKAKLVLFCFVFFFHLLSSQIVLSLPGVYLTLSFIDFIKALNNDDSFSSFFLIVVQKMGFFFCSTTVVIFINSKKSNSMQTNKKKITKKNKGIYKTKVEMATNNAKVKQKI